METLGQLQDHVETKLFGLLVMEKKGNIGVEMVEKIRGSKPTKMKNTDYRDGLHLVVVGRIPQVLVGDGTEPHEEEARWN